MAQQLMRTVAVVGTGLIGTSVALALRGQGVTTYLLDRDPEAARAAESLGAGIAGAPRTPVDLAVIAVPPLSTAAVLREQQQGQLATYFTDVASVKSIPQQAATELRCDLTRYVGGHPMAGREQSGPHAARADLFHNRPWVLAPSRHSRPEALEHATRLAELCGASPLTMAHADHDRAVALTSHTPHLVSSLLAARLVEGDESQLRLAGQGVRDMTRIAAGDVALWSEILASNAPAVEEVLEEVARDLDAVRDALRDVSGQDAERRRSGSARLTAALVRGVRGHARIPERRATMDADRLDVCLVGMGPRGLSVLERLCANTEGHRGSVTVHVVDPYPPGAGRVWRTGQSPHLLMNTVASQVTMFTDESVRMRGPLAPGPSLYEWARALTGQGPYDLGEAGPYDEAVLAEAGSLGPDSYPSRSLNGHYLEWVFRRVLTSARGRVSTVVHKSRAVALRDEVPGGTQSVRLENGTVLGGLHAVVLAQGHVPVRGSAEQFARGDFAKRNELRYVAPANPADVDLSEVRPGETVALLGLGLNFFDYMALFTLGRGGEFVRGPGGLAYRPSGREPVMVACSRRGLPFHSRGENQKGAHGRHTPAVLTPEVVEELRQRARSGGLDFRADLWPLIAKEVETVYYTTLLASTGDTTGARALRDVYLGARDRAEEGRVLDLAGVAPRDRWDWERVARPYLGRSFASPEEFTSWLLGHLREDLAAARAGNVDGPLKAALDVLRDLRNEIRLVIDHGGLTGRSRRDDLDGWYTPLNAFLSIGPPARRIEEAVALIEAGVLRVLGPEVEVATDENAQVFTVRSPAVPGSRLSATTLIEARLPEVDVSATADPLLLQLLADGQCRTYDITDPDGYAYRTGGMAVSASPFHLLDASGTPHPRRFVFGVPTESVHWATAAGIRPGVDSVTLQDSDALARAVLALAESPAVGATTVKAALR
ncbi:prephenate dehydrogenase [Streptomyces sp. NPDC059255]|uniref:prephenate dehydrogenase n=1 Tax=Streptomyces sp. NPDC059255 TaxID=3346793 RepID=UPI0036C20D15